MQQKKKKKNGLKTLRVNSPLFSTVSVGKNSQSFEDVTEIQLVPNRVTLQ